MNKELASGSVNPNGITITEEQLKDLVLYGKTKFMDVTTTLNYPDDGQMDYLYNRMIDLLKTSTMFDVERFECVLWGRIKELTNLKNTNVL